MSTGDAPHVVHIDIPPHEVNLTLDYLLDPLLQTATGSTQNQPAAAAAGNQELSQHLQNMADLLTQLKDVVGKINDIDPSVFASKPAPAPDTPAADTPA